MKSRLLIVDDEADMLRLLSRSVGKALNCYVETAASGEAALRVFAPDAFDLVLLDIRMAGMGGIAVLEEIQARAPGFTVVMMTAYGAIEVAVEALRKGAYDFITKPFDHDELIHHLGNALERGRLLQENSVLKKQVNATETFQGLVGASPVMQGIYDTIDMLSKSDLTVLITGASGTGKNLAAQALHDLSARSKGPFVRVSCPTVPENILESELFGYAKGAFTHASTDHQGLFEAADGGTIFLDEIGDIPPSIQTKLLQVLENNEFKPLGRNRTVRVNVRVMAATNRDLKEKMARGEFREDLYFRLCVVELPMPSLSQRQEDLPLLVDHFLDRYCGRYGREKKLLAPDVMPQLMAHAWKGNVRELENAVKRAVVMSTGTAITMSDLGWKPQECVAGLAADDLTTIPYRDAKESVLAQFSTRYLEKALEKSGGNVTQAAHASGMERQSFQQVMRKYGIRSDTFRKGAMN
jgi:DNA-binding NtrC family response regulator